MRSQLAAPSSNVLLNWIESELPIKQLTEQEPYLEGLRRAGLT
jgi:hypothetical protein